MTKLITGVSRTKNAIAFTSENEQLQRKFWRLARAKLIDGHLIFDLVVDPRGNQFVENSSPSASQRLNFSATSHKHIPPFNLTSPEEIIPGENLDSLTIKMPKTLVEYRPKQRREKPAAKPAPSAPRISLRDAIRAVNAHVELEPSISLRLTDNVLSAMMEIN